MYRQAHMHVPAAGALVSFLRVETSLSSIFALVERTMAVPGDFQSNVLAALLRSLSPAALAGFKALLPRELPNWQNIASHVGLQFLRNLHRGAVALLQPPSPLRPLAFWRDGTAVRMCVCSRLLLLVDGASHALATALPAIQAILRPQRESDEQDAFSESKSDGFVAADAVGLDDGMPVYTNDNDDYDGNDTDGSSDHFATTAARKDAAETGDGVDDTDTAEPMVDKQDTATALSSLRDHDPILAATVAALMDTIMAPPRTHTDAIIFTTYSAVLRVLTFLERAGVFPASVIVDSPLPPLVAQHNTDSATMDTLLAAVVALAALQPSRKPLSGASTAAPEPEGVSFVLLNDGFDTPGYNVASPETRGTDGAASAEDMAAVARRLWRGCGLPAQPDASGRMLEHRKTYMLNTIRGSTIAYGNFDALCDKSSKPARMTRMPPPADDLTVTIIGGSAFVSLIDPPVRNNYYLASNIVPLTSSM